MKRRWLIIFTTVLALLGTLPRLHCLCHNDEVLLITASVVDCCHSQCMHAGASVSGSDLSCFRSVDSQAVGGTSLSPNPPAPAIATVCLPFASLPPYADLVGSVSNATRGPPFMAEYSLGLYLLFGVLLI